MLDLHISHHNAGFMGSKDTVLDEKGKPWESTFLDTHESSTSTQAEHDTSVQAQGAGRPLARGGGQSWCLLTTCNGLRSR